jgi:hypothetical protein
MYVESSTGYNMGVALLHIGHTTVHQQIHQANMFRRANRQWT